MFFSEDFLAERPLLEAIRSDEPVVLLIDEVDRADEALEAVLLETLGEFQVSVPEIGTFVAKHAPYVILTSNNTRDLAAALKRRCLHLFLDYPTAERELEIVRSKDTGLPEAAARELVEVVRGLRELELRKAPSISETIDWARTLAVLGIDELNSQVLSDTVSVVVKYDKDVTKALGALPKLVDPNAEIDGRARPRPWPRARPRATTRALDRPGAGHAAARRRRRGRRPRRPRGPRGEGRGGPPRRRVRRSGPRAPGEGPHRRGRAARRSAR